MATWETWRGRLRANAAPVRGRRRVETAAWLGACGWRLSSGACGCPPAAGCWVRDPDPLCWSLEGAVRVEVTRQAVAAMVARGWRVTGGVQRDGAWICVTEMRGPGRGSRLGPLCSLMAAVRRMLATPDEVAA